MIWKKHSRGLPMAARDWDSAHRPEPKIPRPELQALQSIDDPDQRLYLRFYLRSNIESDLEIARARCDKYGIDYELARDEARRS